MAEDMDYIPRRTLAHDLARLALAWRLFLQELADALSLTNRGRWLLVYLPAFLLLEVTIITVAWLIAGPDIFRY